MLKLRKFHQRGENHGASKKPRLSREEKAERKTQRKRRLRHIFKKYLLPIFGLCLLTVVLFGVLILTVSSSMMAAKRESLVSSEAASALHSEGAFDCILVLGAGLRPDGSPSDMLYDRVAVGVTLYHALGKIPLLMSGDQTGDYNEVAAMKNLAVSLGAHTDHIYMDPMGYSTYESIVRARDIYGADRILIVTQEYHLYRALYLAEALGMEAYGVSADLRSYAGQTKREVRECLARFKDLYFGARKEHPTFTDPPVSFFQKQES